MQEIKEKTGGAAAADDEEAHGQETSTEELAPGKMESAIIQKERIIQIIHWGKKEIIKQ